MTQPRAANPKDTRRRSRAGRVSAIEALREGVGAMRTHPLRALLAGLAIAAAVATIAIVVVALDGIERFARTNAARTFGADTFVIAKVAAPGRISRQQLERKLERNPNIRRADLRVLERWASGRVIYGATVNRRVEIVAGSRRYRGGTLIGATADLAEIRDLAIDRGRFFTHPEEARARQVAVLGAVLVDELFPAVDPLGQTVRIGGRGFEVIGLQERQGNIAGASLDRNVWIPLPALERAFGAPETLQLLARAPRPDEPSATEEAEGRARVSMRARHQLEPGEEDDFDILSPEASRTFVQSLSERIGVAAAPISAMALLAAIVVVANTILVSVTQRTREIGVRRAVGASQWQILAEILAESVAIALLGGLAGVLTVYALVGLVNRAGLDLRVEISTVAWGLLAASASGLLAGWFPARHATRIDVVEALRID
jgi:putative ABC transport system permease protein